MTDMNTARTVEPKVSRSAPFGTCRPDETSPNGGPRSGQRLVGGLERNSSRTTSFPARTLRRTVAVSQDINVLALVKGAERYVFLYDDASRAEALRVLGRYASNPELSFSWYDAAVLSQKIRQESQKATGPRRFQLPQLSDTDEMF